MPAEKTVQEFLTAPVLLLRRLFGEGASGTAGAEGRLPSGRPRPPSTRCAAPDAHAPKNFKRDLKTVKRGVLHCNFPLGKEKPVIFRGIFRESKEGRRSGVFIFVFEKRIGFFK